MTPHASHTPGPWVIGDKGESAPHTSHILGGGHKVCTVESYPYSTTGKADARLIAAAPELLAALQAVSRLDYLNEHNALADMVRSAISKATQAEGMR